LSPILVRPVREQLEHDRVIRLLQAKLKRKYDVAVNLADEQTAGIKVGTGQMFPDLVLTSQDKSHRLEGVIEVETGESVNHLEAMAQWAHFGRVRAPFHLYVPAAAVDIARRLCAENDVSFSEIWSYHSLGDQTRFTLVAKSATKPPPRPAAANNGKPAAKSHNGKPANNDTTPGAAKARSSRPETTASKTASPKKKPAKAPAKAAAKKAKRK
jgi:hypothetical protein